MGGDDFEEFKEIRRHVGKLRTGTPLLLRTAVEGQDQLHICTFWVTEDLQMIRWREQEGSGSVSELPLSSVASLRDASEADVQDEQDQHFELCLKLRKGAKRPAALPEEVSLICSSREDLESWREGLQFLIEPQETVATGGNAEAEELRQKLEEQESLCERLKRENSMLREIVKRKDATIADLLRDTSRCGKTESTSRESDEHLRVREVTILKTKNRKLQKELKAKQQTVTDLLQMLDRVTKQQGAESSAAEETAQEEVVDDEDDEEEDETPAPRIQPPVPPQPRANGSAHSQPAKAVSAPPEDEEPRILQEEMNKMAALAGKLQELEQAAAMATGSVPGRFQPPARVTLPSPARAAVGPKSAAALDAVAREMALLEEKKRLVERLAKALEPGAGDDEEEQDGFPLR
eukprot:TRINITY_DN123_c0_g2_i1.p1 TRINITY_DN123_c0_g2~~TRINITY_DN123_c0_g2_i1.p1  ORF type:complete len:407 (-),score=126.92 TRINITY_DN123_c0_g2_i1:50-1270(-)